MHAIISRRSTSDSNSLPSHSNEVTPIDTLPPELLGYIFETTQTMLLPSEDDFRCFPFIPAQVSQYWRLTVLATPALWSNVDISPPWNLSAIQTYIDRSKESLIDLHLLYDFISPDEHPSTDSAHSLAHILQPHYRRCRTIEVSGDTQIIPAILVVLESMQHSTYPHLQRFLVEGTEMADADHDVFTLRDAPMLTDVRLRGTGLHYFRLPLTNVTELHLAPVENALNYAIFFEMIQSCSASLVTLVIYDGLFAWWREADMVSRVSNMPSLRHIHIYGNMLAVSELLLTISAPDLEEIAIAPFVGDDLVPLEEDIQRKKSPRFPKLKSLTLTLIPASDVIESTLDRAEFCFPGIQTLVLPNPYWRDVLRGLTSRGGIHSMVPRWPQLDSVALRALDDNFNVLHQFILDRQEAGAPIRTLYLDAESVKKLVHCEDLKEMVSIVEADPWLVQQSAAFYSEQNHRFIGGD